ncbi:DUF1361 domain-containing protein [Sporolactobacillus terrae]|uniref:DUF1361 domain-containing protein n=1 Tax=Sporolactobacillus terrae TaxID=269673 RepID=A0ABX5Q7A0_9BACL|nr:DUF1361 domain-containing protein [Sporolactobacillus terrae]QAA22510.1 DUF1361 domain-containing protein [Sporolactobacillus terrae]QAA25484.1 DUF1361 domain-containing protein [Sporolactobacillus terrae]UAK17296.1 DUF1361 domain-containing protein [Sporolactobacillus terrae]
MFYRRRHAPHPIVYCTACYVLISLLLFIITKRSVHLVILWNVFLANVPLLLVLLMCLEDQRRDSFRTGLLGVLWLIFFPNAPYLVTDFIHLQNITFYTTETTDVYTTNFWSWLGLIQIGTAVFIGLFSGMLSLWIIHHRFLKRLISPLAELALLMIFITSGAAVYIGRFLRLNSWDLFYPVHFITQITGHINSFSIAFSLMSAGAVGIGYCVFSVLLMTAAKISRLHQ